MNRNLKLAGAAGVLLIAASAAAYFYGGAVGANPDSAEAASAPQGPPPAPVAIAKAESKSLAPRAETPGAVVSLRDSRVAAATGGKVEWVAEVGAEVDEGHVIARLDQADAKYTRDDTAAQVRRLRARADYLDSLYKRYLGLGEDAGESEATLDEMRSNVEEALQALRQAEVALDRAQTNLDRTEVKAPFAGRIVSQETQKGEFANPGTELVRLVDTHHLEVTARAPAGLTRNIQPGAVISVANGAETLDGRVRAIVPVGDDRSRMLEIRLELPETNWYIGSAVRVSLPSDQPRIVTAVPRDALVLRADRISVFVISEDKVAKRVDVELGAADGDFIEVLGDVEPGDDIVIRGGERLRDGQSVTFSEVTPEPSV
ncbi:efflux RND transporter periplasmic adaptor subunit [Hyphococcus sp.]|uniref:efflux RND transporter periplasmic adaptor subunit n=1 Tax=Hyphococcus sp. TaxID=2038636 RepID=UPI002086250C|nr:MAG: hemolysin D [Marinicaulis sp.]